MESTNANGWVDKLKTLYLEGRYDEAEQILLSKRSSYPSGVFYFNIGTLKVKKGEFGKARYGLEKALSEGYMAPQVFYNLKLVKEKIKVSDISESHLWKDRAYDNLIKVSPDYYLGATFFLLILSIFLIRIGIVRSVKKIILVVLISLGPFLFNLTYLSKIKFGVALEKTNIYEGPSKIFSKVLILEEGSKFVVGPKNGNWYLIISPSSMTGWVSKDKVGLLGS